ncbi:MAG: hypothetical protein GXY83_27850 [Rhodopirellula sp.]|nr:hypothetical protein [Rhodopirellula sp.]
MDFTTDNTNRQVEYISLVDSLTREWIKLPLAVMQDCGPAAQTFGGLLRVTDKETFVEVTTIAGKARLPVATVRKHLVTLASRGWINNRGRQETRRGRLRRTSTIALTAKARDNLTPYGVLPWWACGFVIQKKRKLSWGAKAVLSLVLARLMRFTSAAERQDGHGCEADDVVGAVEHMGGDDRFRMGLRWIERQTGLTRETVAHAKRELTGAKLVKWYGGPDETGCQTRHIVAPNWEARIVVTPSGREGLVKLHIEEVSDDE